MAAAVASQAWQPTADMTDDDPPAPTADVDSEEPTSGFLHLLAEHCDQLLKKSGPAELDEDGQPRSSRKRWLHDEEAEEDDGEPPPLAALPSSGSSTASEPGSNDMYRIFHIERDRPPEQIERDGTPAAHRALPPLPGPTLSASSKDAKDEFVRHPFLCERPACPPLPDDLRDRLDAGGVAVKCTSSWGRDPRVVANRRHHLSIRMFQGGDPLPLAPFVRCVLLQPYMMPRSCSTFRRIDISGFKPTKCARVLDFRAEEAEPSVVRAKVQTMLKETDLAAWDIAALCFQVGLFAREGRSGLRLLGWAMTEEFTSCSKQAVKEKQARFVSSTDDPDDD